MTNRNQRVCVEYVGETKPSNGLSILLDAVQGLSGCRSEVELLELSAMASRKLSGLDRAVLAEHAREMHRRLAIR